MTAEGGKLSTVSGQELFSLGGETEVGKEGCCTCPSVHWVHSCATGMAAAAFISLYSWLWGQNGQGSVHNWVSGYG